MFRAFDNTTRQDVVLGSSKCEWRIEDLRNRARAGELACPVCQCPVTVKAGEVKRSHFAHKSIADCPLSNEPVELLDARMSLFRWLESKNASAGIEEVPDGLSLPRPFDAYVQTDRGKRFGYWIIVRGMRNRKPMLALRRNGKIDVHWIFLAVNLNRHESHLRDVRLTTTERDFTSRSRYDHPSCGAGTLHYLDVQSESLTSLRGLMHIEGPVHEFGRLIRTPLDQILISPTNGELVHPGEHERFLQREAQEGERQEKQAARSRAGQSFASHSQVRHGATVANRGTKSQSMESDFEKALAEVKRRWKEDGVNPDLPGWIGQVREEALRLMESRQR